MWRGKQINEWDVCRRSVIFFIQNFCLNIEQNPISKDAKILIDMMLVSLSQIYCDFHKTQTYEQLLLVKNMWT